MEDKIKSPWPGPEGLIPVTNGKAEDANKINRQYLDDLLVEMRVIDAVEPNLETEIFGRRFSSPIMMPAFSHLNKVGKDGRKPMEEYAMAAKELNVLNWVGMEPDDEFASIAEVGAPTVRIIKPFADHDMIMKQIAFAERHGAFAVGIDIDHIAGKDGHYDIVDGLLLGPITKNDLAGYTRSTKLPFIARASSLFLMRSKPVTPAAREYLSPIIMEEYPSAYLLLPSCLKSKRLWKAAT